LLFICFVFFTKNVCVQYMSVCLIGWRCYI